MFKKLGIRIFKKVAKREVLAKLADAAFKEKIIKLINEKVDVPELDEKEEAKYLGQLYEVLTKIAGDVIEDL